jgi:hypothetical protein
MPGDFPSGYAGRKFWKLRFSNSMGIEKMLVLTGESFSQRAIR